MLGALTSLTGGGSMPIDAGGGAAGPSTATATTNNGFTVGGLNMGAGESNKTLLVVGAVGLLALFLLTRGKK
ncbi:hypothetical protein [Vibrio algarum]|uniref:LPXTG cell wall anchor domain-containing protein n=1 Tax=Vibrio algarum TaxID=3020714 RepID=A0ABT4YMQ7_9VIBR|nr:hypothetical protein [Vibrio sp. KJ40-1]MDB1122836.1 hypothetical protein [Vibrio sp. KJ40-1]